jgi:hypothetical protein
VGILFLQYYLWIISSSLLFCKTKKEKKRRGENRREQKERNDRRNHEKRDSPKDSFLFPSLQATTMLRSYANRENHLTQYSQTMMSELMPHGYENMFFALFGITNRTVSQHV